MAITDFEPIIARVRAYTGFDVRDITDAYVQIFLEDAVSIVYEKTGHEVDGADSHDVYVIVQYGCGASTNYVNGPEVKKLEVADTRVTFASGPGGIATNQFLENFWNELIDMDATGGLEKSTWNLSTYFPVAYNKDQKRYRRIDEEDGVDNCSTDLCDSDLIFEDGDGPDV